MLLHTLWQQGMGIRPACIQTTLHPACLLTSVCPAHGQEGFSTKRPSSGHGRASGDAPSGWASPQWRAVQANLTQQLKDSDSSFDNYRVSDVSFA